MPGVYRVFHFSRQPLDRITLPWLVQPCNPAISPLTKGKNYHGRKNHRKGGGGGEGKLAGKNLVAEQRCWKKTPRATESVRGLVNYRECAHLPRTTPINYICSRNRLFCSARHKQSRQNFEVSKKTQLPCQALS